jgi:hypothetical protein
MIVNSKIRVSDWSTYELTIVNFNSVFTQAASEQYFQKRIENKKMLENVIVSARRFYKMSPCC